MRIHNIDSYSALLDRLITENIKLMQFRTDNNTKAIAQQIEIISHIKTKLIDLFGECLSSLNYYYIGELRTHKSEIIDKLEQLVEQDVHMGLAEKEKIKLLNNNNTNFIDTIKTDLYLRKSNENRANIKNSLDILWEKIINNITKYQSNSIETIINDAYKIGMSQIKEEITQTAKFVYNEQPTNILEIGTKLGGVFYVLCNLSKPNGIKISLDLQGGPYGGWILGGHAYLGQVLKNRNNYFKKQFKNVYMLNANSHDKNTEQKIRTILGNKKLDILFIDGDHTYEGVKQDFYIYSRFVRNGGSIILHDINDSKFHQEKNVGVYKLWNELTGEKYEFNMHSHWGGIGIWRKSND